MQMSFRATTFLNLLLSIPARASTAPLTTTTTAITRSSPTSSSLLVLTHPFCPLSQFHSHYSYYSTMSKPNETTRANQTQPEPEPERDQTEQSRPQLALPDRDTADKTHTLDISGDGSTAKLDHLGPIVVNRDGTLARITNWEQMAEIERVNTLRMLSVRNKKRLGALKAEKEG